MANPLFGSNKIEVVSDMAAAEREVQSYLGKLSNEPEVLLPFAVDRNGAADAFKKWLGSLSLVPGDLTTKAELAPVKAVCVPFWAVHSMTYTGYVGERGEEYKDTEYYTDASGQGKTREVTKIAWKPASGEVKQNFDNLYLCAAGGLPETHVALLSPKEVRDPQPYSEGATADATVMRSGLDPKAAFNKARTMMEAEIRKLVEKDIGGKQQKVTKMETRHLGVSLRQLLVPAYEGTYRYGGKDYKVLVNGVNGQVTGDHPVSAGKVALVILIFLAVVAAIFGAIWFFLVKPNMNKQKQSERSWERPALVRTIEAEPASQSG